jgi:hypothetical protein
LNGCYLPKRAESECWKCQHFKGGRGRTTQAFSAVISPGRRRLQMHLRPDKSIKKEVVVTRMLQGGEGE